MRKNAEANKADWSNGSLRCDDGRAVAKQFFQGRDVACGHQLATYARVVADGHGVRRELVEAVGSVALFVVRHRHGLEGGLRIS